MADNKKTIFISYGRDQENPEDVELVRRVKRDLEEEGFEVLMDEEQLRSADVWDEKLENMILNSDWILYFITPYSARRPEGYCLNELAMSLAYKKPVAPVMVRYEVPPLSICRIQYLDLESIDINDEQQYQKKIDEIISVIREDNRLGFEGDHLRVLSELEPIKFETMISKHSKRFVGREWLYKQVNEWLDDGTSRVLWLQAEAGFGKSAIATYLASKHPSALSVYFCQYDYAESKDPREMLKVLIYELSTQLPEYHKILQTLHLKDALSKSAEHIFTQLLLEPLQRISKPDTKFFFVIDALDEANKENKNEIVELIANRFLDLPVWLGIVMTSRPEPELERKLKKFNHVAIDAEEDDNLKDMEMLLGENYGIDDPHIIEALIRKSEGNVLYLKSLFDLDIIKKNELDTGSIDKLPPTMEGFFLTYFERKFPDIEEYEEKYLDFVSLLVSQEGLEEIFVKDILNLSDREYKQIKSTFGSLLEINDGVLTFYHKSIFEWLKDYDKSGDYSADLKLSKKLLENFFSTINEDNYQEEYLNNIDINIMLFEYLYNKNHSINSFFKIMERQDNSNKVIKILRFILFSLFGNNSLDIEFSNATLEYIEKLFKKDKNRWINEYVNALHEYAMSIFIYSFSQGIEKDIIEVINNEKKALQILEQTNINKFNSIENYYDLYLSIVKQLILSYSQIGRFSEGLYFFILYLKILSNIYKNDTIYKYFNKELKDILNFMFDFQYNNLLYGREEDIKVVLENFKNFKKIYIKNPTQYEKEYVNIGTKLGIFLIEDDKTYLAMKIFKDIRGTCKKLFKQNKRSWINIYITILGNISADYKNYKISSEAALEGINILKKYFDKNEKYRMNYILLVMNLSNTYIYNTEYKKAIEILENVINMAKKYYDENHPIFKKLIENKETAKFYLS